MSILTAIQDACPDIGLDKPLTVVSISDPNAVRLLAFAHEAGDDIAQRGDWRRMLASVTSTSSPIALPDNSPRLVPGGAVNLIAPIFAPIRGPLSSDQFTPIAAGRFGVASQLYYTMNGANVVLSRVLVAGESVQVDYVRREWMIDSTGVNYKTRATQDSDIFLFPERLLTDGIVWRFRRETGLQYQDQMAEWEAKVAMELRQDRGVTT